MIGIDDDLMDDGIIQSQQEELKTEVCNNQTNVHKIPEKNRNGLEKIFNIIYYCVDGAMLLLSFIMMDYHYDAYPLFFCFGLVIWMGYRMLFFRRNQVVNYILGFFLFVIALTFYIWAFCDDYNDSVGKIMIPTVYLGYFCAWGAIMRKEKGVGSNDNKDK